MFISALLLFAQMELHDGHDWLEGKKDHLGRSCCNKGDCLPVSIESFSVGKDGSVSYGNYNIPFYDVFPTQDKKGRAFICIFRGEARCAFIQFGV